MSNDTRLRIMRVLWGAFLLAVGLLAFVGYAAAPPATAEPGGGAETPPLLYVFFGLGVTAAAASFAVRRSLEAKAAREQSPAHVQTGLVVALALCESAALFGMAALFITGDRRAFYLFALAALAELLHFPRRGPLEGASAARRGGMSSSMR